MAEYYGELRDRLTEQLLAKQGEIDRLNAKLAMVFTRRWRR